MPEDSLPKSEYKHFSESDLQFAQHIAKLNLNKERDNHSQVSTSNLKSKALSFQIDDGSEKNVASSTNIGNLHLSAPVINKAQSGSKVPSRPKKYQEGNMRIKQAVRTAYDLSKVIERLENKSKEKCGQLPFVTPLELEKKTKRWEDFSHLARRSLYTLKREVSLLSVKISGPLGKLSDTILRMLSSATRSCLHILKGLENFEEDIKEGQRGHFLLREALLTGRRILFIMTMGGASLSGKSSSPTKNDKLLPEFSEENSSKSFEILTSDLDNSKVSELLNPKMVRRKLSSLVHSVKTKNRKEKTRQTKYINPLKDEIEFIEASKNHHYPVVEELDNGRKIEFVNDSLSPKLRRQHLRRAMKVSYTRGRMDEEGPSSSGGEPGSYGVSEKMADAVFERILPYINSEEKELLETSTYTSKTSIEITVLLEAQKRLDELQTRFDKLELTTQQHRQFLSEIKSKLSTRSKRSPNALDLEEAIEKAKVCLEKCNKADNTFPYQDSSVDVIVDNLLKSYGQETEHVLPQRPELLTMQDEVRALRGESWNRLMDQGVVVPSTEVVARSDVEVEVMSYHVNENVLEAEVETHKSPIEGAHHSGNLDPLLNEADKVSETQIKENFGITPLHLSESLRESEKNLDFQRTLSDSPEESLSSHVNVSEVHSSALSPHSSSSSTRSSLKEF